MAVMEETSVYLSGFEQLARRLAAGDPSWLASIRREAIEAFAAKGFPTTSDERWRATNVAPIARVPFAPAPHAGGNGLSAESLERATYGIRASARLVFIDGRFSAELSAAGPLLAGVRAGSLARALRSDPDLLEPHLARYARPADHAFVALNTAFIEDGGFVRVPRGVVLDAPVHMIFVSKAAVEPTVRSPRNLVIAEESSSVTVVESYVRSGDALYFTNAVTEVVVGENAKVEHVKLQRESERAFHVAVLEARVGRSGTFASHSISLGGSLARTDIDVELVDEGADCTLNGLFMATGRQHVDHHTTIDHAMPRGTSRELYKGILDGSARGVFDGKIIVRPDATKTDARQTNRNLLLSEDSLIDTKPQLEILNDDVKCSHAATIGRLDEDALFYLRSRGIDRESARAMMTKAFASDVVAGIQLGSIRDGLDTEVSEWMARRGRGEVTA